MKNNTVVYREVQRPRQIFVWIFVLLFAGFTWYAFIQQVLLGNPIGNKPAPNASIIVFWLIFAVAFPVILLGFFKLIIEVRADGIYIRFLPFHLRYRVFLFEELIDYKPIEYNTWERFGGWGVRVNFAGETLYSMGKTKGVELKLHKRTIVIGSEDPSALIKALDSAQRK